MSANVPNWQAVSPEARKRVEPLVAHYKKQPHPFGACVADNTKRFGKNRAERICAVVKDMGEKRTTWRNGGGGGKAKEGDPTQALLTLVEESEARIAAVGALVGGRGVHALVVGALRRDAAQLAEASGDIGEALLADLVVIREFGGAARSFAPMLTDPAVVEAAQAREAALSKGDRG